MVDAGLTDEDASLTRIASGVMSLWLGAGTGDLIGQQVGRDHGDVVSIAGMLTDRITGARALSYKDITPLAILVSEAVLFVVSPASTIETGAEPMPS